MVYQQDRLERPLPTAAAFVRHGFMVAIGALLASIAFSAGAAAGERGKNLPNLDMLRAMLERRDRPVAPVVDLAEPSSETQSSRGPGSSVVSILSAPARVDRTGAPMSVEDKFALLDRSTEIASLLAAYRLGGAAARHRDYCSAASSRATMEAQVNGFARSSPKIFEQAEAICIEAYSIADTTVFRRNPLPLPER